MGKRVALVAGGVLALVSGVVLVGGALMPRAHVAESAVVVNGAVDSVWALVRGIERLPAWWPGVERVERVADATGAEVWVQHAGTGPLTIAVVTVDAPHRMVTRIVADSSAAFGGTWTYELRPVQGGTRVAITEDGYINNLIFRFVANAIVGVHGTVDSYLRALGAHFGQDIAPEHVR